MGATTRQDRIAIGTAAAVGASLWLLVGSAWVWLSGADDRTTSLIRLVVPPTNGGELVSGDAGLAGAALAGALVVAAVIAAVGLAVLPRSDTGAPTTVLALWWAAVAGGFLGSVVSLLIMLQPAEFAAEFTYIGSGVLSDWWWGMAYGWLPGFAAVLVLRHGRAGSAAATGIESPGSWRLPLAAGAVAGLGWLALGTVRATITSVSPGALASPVFGVPLPAAGALPGDGYFSRFVATALLAGLVTALVTWIAVRFADPILGVPALGFAVWFAAVAGSIVGPFLVNLTQLGFVLPFGVRAVLGYLVDLLSAGGRAGLVYGWIPALAVVLLVRRRSATVVAADAAALAGL